MITHPIGQDDRQQLELVSSAGRSPLESYLYLRSLLSRYETLDVVEATYDALRSVVFQTVSARQRDANVDAWTDVVLKIRMIVRSRSEALAERFTVLADLLEQASRFGVLHPSKEARRKTHNIEILAELAAVAHPVEKAKLCEKTGVRPSNMSRILGNLAVHGWISREYAGREVLVQITAEGRRQLPPGTKGASLGVFSRDGVAAAMDELWTMSGVSFALTDDKAGVLSCDPTFAKLLGAEHPDMVLGWDVNDLRARISKMDRGDDEVAADEVILPDGSTIRVVEHQNDGRSIWLGFDVTAYKRRLDVERASQTMLRHQEMAADVKSAKGRKPQAVFLSHEYLHQASELSALQAMIRNVRQDLLTPIIAINNAAHLMDRGASHGLLETPAEQAALIMTQSERVWSALREILSVCDVQATIAGNISQFDSTALFRDLAESLTYTRRYDAQTVQFYDGDIASMKADESLVRAGLRNALVSVMDVTAHGGKIAVTTEKVDRCVKYSITSSSVKELASREALTLAAVSQLALHKVGGQFEFKHTGNKLQVDCLFPI